MTSVTKSFLGVRALHDVSLELHSGEVLALLGENGAGKSTLIKILGGVHQPDDGKIEIDGELVRITSPAIAQRAGIGVIHQEFNLVPTLSARENIFLGQEPSRVRFLRARDEFRKAEQLFEKIGVTVNPNALCRDLTVAQQQAVEIAKALALKARILVMDEPSAALSPHEVARLFSTIRELKEHGLGVIYISHRLSEIFEVADRVMVLRDGEQVGTRAIGELTRDAMIEMMVGRSLQDEFPSRATKVDTALRATSVRVDDVQRNTTPRLVVEGLRRGVAVRDVSLHVNRGEIVALTGLVGAGRTELARLIFGADRAEAGTVTLDGRQLRIRSPRDAIAAGICLLTEDRKSQGLVLGLSVQHNYGLPNLSRFSRFGLIRDRRERTSFQRLVDQLRIRVTGPRQQTNTLSGGNQQKVVLAKWLERNAELIIFDEPTRGIDVGAKYEIYQLIHKLADQGKAIVMISSELPEVLGMAERILVMHEGRITGEITDPASATQQEIMNLAVM